mmetsp:Transcript_50348/g.121839  ORF Transcript_50348/g.121839 Transcript_50348/m.121839 type:complete len:118 (+) Transcript_50348:404-757(+)|eukprot:CAMPEP_0113475358 /NCGR_PEP_ID=MMETSP0014_2-20120614/19078_1 /TAXON_ID=2857 /ORGANISM="Nitzschia sp." /LENGTH=117 /DNA_ID=CAMNT_0000368273 /DNA_START=352 /DNA_END=705 /DNA_ORIENTATION=+ /assembly_acc=CAM_ASM_000159
MTTAPQPNVPEQWKNLTDEEFSADFHIKWKSTNVVEIQPKEEPSKLAATFLPMWKTRYSYDIIFNNAADSTTMRVKDNYAITFNRSNGATPDQQERIHEEEQYIMKHCQNIMTKMKN